jgi:hypothetical protein
VIELEDGFVTDEQLANEITGADIILAPYQNHIGSSGVMHWAVAAKKPLIAQDTGLIGYQVSKYGLGTAINCGNPKVIANEIGSIMNTAPKLLKTFAKRHGPSKFVGNILNETLQP